MKNVSPITVMCILAALYIGFSSLQIGGCPFELPDILSPVTTHATMATYVYEKDEGGVPSFVGSALDKLNRRTPPVLATPFDKDQKDASGQTPLQYQVALKAALDKGLPCLVVQAGDKLIKVLKDVKTEEQILEEVP